MARPDCLLIPALALFLACPLSAQEATPQEANREPEQRQDGDKGKRHHEGKRKMSPEMQNVRRAIEALNPEQRKRFEENFSKWANLPAEEKKSLRHREEMRRKRMSEDIDEAVKKSGLTLTETQRQQFAQRYADERRKLEEELRKEMDEKRQPRLDVIVGKLAKEFAGAVQTAPTPQE